jgi:hypothetical protein
MTTAGLEERAIGRAERAIAPLNLYFVATIALSLASALWFIYLSMPMAGWVAADFKVFWTAGRIEQRLAYDFAAVSAAIPGETGLRPFLSPPTLLLALKPLLGMPLWPAFALWTILGLASFCRVSARAAGPASILLLLSAPAFHWAAIAGQVTLLVGALLYSGVLCLSRRPIAAGLLFAAAALLKPQAALLVPLALIAGGHYRALFAALAAGSLGGLLSLTVHGPEMWIGWLRAIGAFGELIRSNGFIGKGITPSALAYGSQLQGVGGAALVAGGALLGLSCCWLVFRRSDDPALRGGALVCGALLCTPYAMSYEAASLLPAAAALLTKPGRRFAAVLTAGLVACFPFSSLSVAFFGLGLIAAALAPREAAAHPAKL